MRNDNGEIRRSGGNGRRSSCVAYGGVLYVSGITTVDLDADMSGQARDIFTQLDRLLALYGTDKRRILSAAVYLKTMDDYGDFNAAWDEWVDDSYEPARSVVGAELPLPGYRVKVSLTAALNG